MAGSGAKVSDCLSAKHIPVVTVQTCAQGYAATSIFKKNQPAVVVRDSGHDDWTVLPIGDLVCV